VPDVVAALGSVRGPKIQCTSSYFSFSSGVSVRRCDEPPPPPTQPSGYIVYIERRTCNGSGAMDAGAVVTFVEERAADPLPPTPLSYDRPVLPMPPARTNITLWRRWLALRRPADLKSRVSVKQEERGRLGGRCACMWGGGRRRRPPKTILLLENSMHLDWLLRHPKRGVATRLDALSNPRDSSSHPFASLISDNVIRRGRWHRQFDFYRFLRVL
jgi:hypothetical protein